MPFIKIWIHAVFGTKRHQPFLLKDIRDKVIKHIFSNAKEKNIYLDSVNGYTDHLHCLISLGASQSISKVLNLIKGESSFWINNNQITKTKFEWADEYYAVSVSDSQVSAVRNYIKNQEQHHRKAGYKEESEIIINNSVL